MLKNLFFTLLLCSCTVSQEPLSVFQDEQTNLPLSVPASHKTKILFPEWHWENPLPQGLSLSAIWGSSDLDLYAVGERGTILLTHDGGNSWERKYSGVLSDLHAISGTSDDLFVVGDQGTILHSKDKGKTWTKQENGVSSKLSALWVGENGWVYVIGEENKLLRSPDLGKSWELVELGATLSAIWSNGSNVLIAIKESGEAIRSIDHGSTWSGFPSISVPIHSVWADQAGTFYLVGGTETLYESGIAKSAPSMDENLVEHRFLFRSKDGGLTWDQKAILLNPGLSRPRVKSRYYPPVSRPLSEKMRLFGNAKSELYLAQGNYRLFYSSDRGETWQECSSGNHFTGGGNYREGSYWASSSNAVFFAGTRGILSKSSDQGKSWNPLHQDPTKGTNLLALWTSPSGNKFAVGEYGSILVSSEKNSPWISMSSGVSTNLNDVWGIEYNQKEYLFAVGDYGVILYSHDGGKTFQRAKRGVSKNLYAIWGTSFDNLYAVGKKGTLLHSSDGGITWVQRVIQTRSRLVSLWGNNAENVYIVSKKGKLFQSTDGGITWKQSKIGEIDGVLSIWGTKEGNLYVVGQEGKVLHSADWGKTWNSIASGTTINLRKVWGTEEGDLYIVGGNDPYENAFQQAASASLAFEKASSSPQALQILMSGFSSNLVSKAIFLHSTDQGKTWVQRQVPLSTELLSIRGRAANDLYILSTHGQILHRTIPF